MSEQSDHEKARDLMRRLVEVANEDGKACIGGLGEEVAFFRSGEKISYRASPSPRR